MVRSCLLVTLIKCPKGHKCVGLLCRLVKTLIVSSVRQTKGPSKGQGHLLSCSRQLKSPSYHFGRLSSTENKVTKNKYTSYSSTRFRERFRRVFGCGKKKPLVRSKKGNMICLVLCLKAALAKENKFRRGGARFASATSTSHTDSTR